MQNGFHATLVFHLAELPEKLDQTAKDLPEILGKWMWVKILLVGPRLFP